MKKYFNYPLLKRHVNIRISKNRYIINNCRTGDSYLENQKNFLLLLLCDGSRTLEEILEIYKGIFSLSLEEAQEQAEEMLTKYGEAIDYYEAGQKKRHILNLALFQKSATWAYSPLRDEYPYRLTIVLTECCNHKCNYCFNSCDSRRHQEVNIADWFRVINQAGDMGVQEITFTGGEPFLYKNFITLIEHCTKKGIYTKISTNGTFLKEDTIKKLKDAGAEYIHLSLPSVSEAVYDKITGSTQDLMKVKQAVRQLKQHGFYIRAKMVLTPQNADEVERLIEFCADEGVDFIHLAPYILTENSRGGRQLLPNEDVLLNIKRIADEKRKKYKHIVISEVPIASLKWSGPQNITRCGGIKDSLTILSNGNITFCEALGTLKEFILGNIHDNTLWEIWNSHKPDLITIPNQKALDRECTECKYFHQCQTGCFVFSNMQSNNPWSIDPRCFRFSDDHNIFDDK